MMILVVQQIFVGFRQFQEIDHIHIVSRILLNIRMTLFGHFKIGMSKFFHRGLDILVDAQQCLGSFRSSDKASLLQCLQVKGKALFAPLENSGANDR